jgi:hypothetical protein
MASIKKWALSVPSASITELSDASHSWVSWLSVSENKLIHTASKSYSNVFAVISEIKEIIG